MRKVQEALVRIGFNLEVDGDFRSRTEKAVREFQRSNGLGVDGVVGPRTAARLGIDLADEGVAGVTDELRGAPAKTNTGGVTIDFDPLDLTIPARAQTAIDGCSRSISEKLNAGLSQSLLALDQFETTMSFDSAMSAEPDVVGSLADFAFEFATRELLVAVARLGGTAAGGLTVGANFVLGAVNAARDELFRAGAANTSATIGAWIQEQRSIMDAQRARFLESKIRDELVRYYLDATDRPARAGEILELKASVEAVPLPVLDDLELIMYETWINAHFVHVRNDAPGCIAYRYEGDDESGFNFLSLEVEAPQQEKGQIEGRLNKLFDNGVMTLASLPIHMAVRKRAGFDTDNSAGGHSFTYGWLTAENQTLHQPLRAQRIFAEPSWRQHASRFRLDRSFF